MDHIALPANTKDTNSNNSPYCNPSLSGAFIITPSYPSQELSLCIPGSSPNIVIRSTNHLLINSHSIYCDPIQTLRLDNFTLLPNIYTHFLNLEHSIFVHPQESNFLLYSQDLSVLGHRVANPILFTSCAHNYKALKSKSLLCISHKSLNQPDVVSTCLVPSCAVVDLMQSSVFTKDASKLIDCFGIVHLVLSGNIVPIVNCPSRSDVINYSAIIVLSVWSELVNRPLFFAVGLDRLPTITTLEKSSSMPFFDCSIVNSLVEKFKYTEIR